MHKKQTVIIASEFPPGPGGIGKHAYDLSKALSWKDHEVTVFASQDFSNESEIIEFNNSMNAGIKIQPFKRTGISTYIKRWKQVVNFIKQHPPDQIVVTGRFSIWLGYFIKLKFKKKFPVHAFIHGSELSNKNKLYYFLTRKALSELDFLWTVSAFTKTQLINIVKRNDIKVLPNGLWLEDWTIGEHDFPPLAGNPSLLTVGRISNRKGQHRVINALPILKTQFPTIHYHIAGIPDNKELILNQATTLGVQTSVSILGKIQSGADLAKIYKASGIFIMLSENQINGDLEGFGIAILEANLMGKPAIGARGCGIEDAITDGFNGRLVDGNNTSEILLALQDITNNYDEYSSRAKTWALNHSWKNLIDRFEKKEGYQEADKITFTK